MKRRLENVFRVGAVGSPVRNSEAYPGRGEDRTLHIEGMVG